MGIEPHQLVTCIQNHDQIGNRAFGERLSHLVDLPSAMAAAALLLLAPWTPLLFQGEEWAASAPFLYFVNHQDPALAKAVAEGRRNDFGHFGWKDEVPDPNATDTFTRSQLDWAEIVRPEHTAMLDWYRALIRIRREADGPADVTYDEDRRWLTLRRGRVLAQFNFAAESQAVPAPPGPWRTVATSRPDGGQLIPAGGTCIRQLA